MGRAFAKRLSAVAPSATLAMNARAAEMKSRGIDVFNFGVGEPDFEPPAHVREAAHRAIDRGASKYTQVPGIPELRAAIAAHARAGSYTADEVCVSIGAKHALFNLALALYEPGDEIVIPAPYWVSYPEQVRLAGATPVIVKTTEASGFRMSAEQLERALTKNTKAIILCTPCNPTGSAYSEKDLRALVPALEKSDAWIIVDEIYAELVYDGFQHVTLGAIAPQLRERIVIVDGVSKTYAMTGWRIGWTLAPKELVKAIGVIQGQSTTNATAVAQYAALAAITGPMDEARAMREKFEKRRNAMVDGLTSVQGMKCRRPEGAFYAFADCRGLYGILDERCKNDEDVANWLLDTAHVVGVPGTPFGAPGYIRFSYATAEEKIAAGIDAMKHAIGAARRV